MRASNAIYDVDEGRPMWKTLPVRILVTLALVVMLALSAIMVIVTGPIASKLGKVFCIGDTAELIWDIAKWPVVLIIVSLMFSLYEAGQRREDQRYRQPMSTSRKITRGSRPKIPPRTSGGINERNDLQDDPDDFRAPPQS